MGYSWFLVSDVLVVCEFLGKDVNLFQMSQTVDVMFIKKVEFLEFVYQLLDGLIVLLEERLEVHAKIPNHDLGTLFKLLYGYEMAFAHSIDVSC